MPSTTDKDGLSVASATIAFAAALLVALIAAAFDSLLIPARVLWGIGVAEVFLIVASVMLIAQFVHGAHMEEKLRQQQQLRKRGTVATGVGVGDQATLMSGSRNDNKAAAQEPTDAVVAQTKVH